MANVKGERIATNLLGRHVTSGDGRDEKDARRTCGWPTKWPFIEERPSTLPSARRAEVVAVYVRDGEVRLLLTPVGFDGTPHDALASEWRVLR